MKIGLISTYSAETPPKAYGGEVYFWHLANELGKLGHEVHLFATEGSKTPEDGFLHIIPGPTKGLINYTIEVGMEIQYHDLLMSMDIIHSCSLDHIEAERLRHLYGKKEIINTINGHCYNMPRPPFNVVTGSKWWQADAQAHGLTTEMIPWGVDTEFYAEGDKTRREEWYLWIARFHPSKGLDLALDLAEMLSIPLKVAGSMEFADHEEHGKKYLERISSLPTVEYVALPMDSTHHDTKRELYQKAKAFLYPVVYNECFGMVVVEAMACGCPVITTPNGAMPELVQDGTTGFICNSKAEFAQAVMKKIPDYWNKSKDCRGFDLWEQSRIWAEKFSVKESAAQYERLYREVIAGKGW